MPFLAKFQSRLTTNLPAVATNRLALDCKRSLLAVLTVRRRYVACSRALEEFQVESCEH